MLMVNDAAMQALGSYRGGRMLFLGLGTGLGSAMVMDGVARSECLKLKRPIQKPRHCGSRSDKSQNKAQLVFIDPWPHFLPML
jgi:hypothetical protein